MVIYFFGCQGELAGRFLSINCPRLLDTCLLYLKPHLAFCLESLLLCPLTDCMRMKVVGGMAKNVLVKVAIV